MLTTNISPEKIVFDDSTNEVEVTITTNGNSIIIGSKNPVVLTGKLVVKKQDLIEENIRIITSDGNQFNIGTDCKLLPVSLKAKPLNKFTFTVDQSKIDTTLGKLETINITCEEEDVVFEVKQDKYGYFIFDHNDKVVKFNSVMMGFNTISIIGRKEGYEDYGIKIPVTINGNVNADIYPRSAMTINIPQVLAQKLESDQEEVIDEEEQEIQKILQSEVTVKHQEEAQDLQAQELSNQVEEENKSKRGRKTKSKDNE